MKFAPLGLRLEYGLKQGSPSGTRPRDRLSLEVYFTTSPGDLRADSIHLSESVLGNGGPTLKVPQMDLLA